MDPKKEPQVEQLKAELGKIASFSADFLANRNDLGALNFQDGLSTFQESINLATELNSLPVEILPLTILTQLTSSFTNLKNFLTQANNFNITSHQNPTGERDKILINVTNHYNAAFTQSMPYVSYLSIRKGQLDSTFMESSKLLEDATEDVDIVLKRIAEKELELNSIVSSAKIASSEVGVAQFSTKFKELSNNHIEYSKYWLITASCLGLITIGIAVWFLMFMKLDGSITDSFNLQKLISKLVIISILYYSAMWATKNYKAHAHLSVVNKHRQAALSTFEAFVKATEDQQTKNAVLLETTRCIFGFSVTGYLGKEDNPPNNSIVEIMKSASSLKE